MSDMSREINENPEEAASLRRAMEQTRLGQVRWLDDDETIESAVSSPTPDSSNGERCAECGGANIVWFTDSALWNEVMGRDRSPILCPQCFVAKAEGLQRPTAWSLQPEARPSPTPDEQAAEEPWEGEDVTPWPEGVYPTPGQLLHLLRVDPDFRQRFAVKAIRNGKEAHHCFVMDHDGRLADLDRALVVARERLAEVETQRDLLAQAMWNARGILGFDNDGDPGPGAAIAGSGYEGFARMHEREAAEARKDDDETFDLSMAYKARLAAVEAFCDEAEREPTSLNAVWTSALRAVLVGRPPTPHPTQEKPE